MKVFVTGGTGFLGSFLIGEILSSSDDEIIALVRAENNNSAKIRLLSKLKFIANRYNLTDKDFNRVQVISGDITKIDLGLCSDLYEKLTKEINVIYHAAGNTDFNHSLDKIREINTIGTKDVLELGVKSSSNGNLSTVNHISTAFIVGNKNCIFKESDLNVGQEFDNTYEQSKFEAEELIHKFREKGLNVNVFRPSVLIGDYKYGITTKFKMLYHPLHFLSLELFNIIPSDPKALAHIINVDVAASLIWRISKNTYENNLTYHITPDKYPLFKDVMVLASDFFGFKLPDFRPISEINFSKEYTPIKKMILEPYLPYFSCLCKFDLTNTLRNIKKDNLFIPEIDRSNLIRIFEYCDKAGFIKKKKSNVII